jgi:hypothetical protein
VNAPSAIVVPSAALTATVRHGDVPGAAPDPLTTRDRTWTLDPLSSLARLVSAARTFNVAAPSQRLLEHALGTAGHGRPSDGVHVELPADEAARLAAVTEQLRDAIAGSGRRGFGLVDATPGRARTGLTRAWSGRDGPEVLVADRRVSVTIDPAEGLSVTVAGPSPGRGGDDGEVVRISGVEEVELAADGVVVRNGDSSLVLDLQRGRVIGWLMPGCTRWRVRPVPEGVVWARTFAGLADSAELAVALGRPVTLTSPRLSETGPRRGHAARPLESRFDQEP